MLLRVGARDYNQAFFESVYPAPGGMIDIHCHILPAIDDGSPDLDTSLTMAAMAAADGIEIIIATPHVDMTGRAAWSRICEEVKRLNNALQEERIELRVLAGAEVQSHVAVTKAGQFCLASGSFFLLEFPSTHLPVDSLEIVHTAVRQRITPIIAHPERNAAIIQEPGKLLPLINAGAKIQITAASLTGDLGPDVAACAGFLVRNSMVHFLGTDSHSPGFREPILSKAVKKASRYMGRKKALALVRDNPLAILPQNLPRN